MKFLFDFFPIIVFYIGYKMYDIYYATAFAIAATFIQISLYWLKTRRFEKMHLITMALITILGGATIYFHDPAFIQWKVSVVNWLFGLVIIGSHYIGKKPLIERMMDHAISMEAGIWKRLNAAWGLFFVGMGFLNLYVMFNFDEATWVDFKVYGLLGLTVAFVIIQSIYLAKHIQEDENEPAEKEI